MTIVIDQEKCIGCGMCKAYCLEHCITLENEKAKIVKACPGCEEDVKCVDFCPNDAIKIQA